MLVLVAGTRYRTFTAINAIIPDFIVIIRGRVFNAIKCSLWGYYECQDVDGFNGLFHPRLRPSLQQTLANPP